MTSIFEMLQSALASFLSVDPAVAGLILTLSFGFTLVVVFLIIFTLLRIEHTPPAFLVVIFSSCLVLGVVVGWIDKWVVAVLVVFSLFAYAFVSRSSGMEG
jgi:hypothetical protein